MTKKLQYSMYTYIQLTVAHSSHHCVDNTDVLLCCYARVTESLLIVGVVLGL